MIAAATPHVHVSVMQSVNWAIYLPMLITATVALMGAVAAWLNAQVNKGKTNALEVRVNGSLESRLQNIESRLPVATIPVVVQQQGSAIPPPGGIDGGQKIG